MCRLLGVVSRAHAPLAEHLADYLKPFAALSSHHCDGWGIACWDEHDDLIVAKAPEQASASPDFWTATAATRTDAALLHLRRASKGMANTRDNTHPFVVGSVAFAHNGWFGPVGPVEDLLVEIGGRPGIGNTDSERYFHLLLASMRVDGPVAALRATAERITGLAQVESLNAVMLTSQALYAFAWSVPVPREPGAESAGGTYQMLFRQTCDTVYVASDGWQTDPEEWEPIANGTVLEISRTDLRVVVHRGITV